MGLIKSWNEIWGLDDDDVKRYQNKYKGTGTGAITPIEEEEEDDSSAGSSSSGSKPGGSKTNNITDTVPPVQNITTDTVAPDDSLTALEAYGKDIAAQQQEEFTQKLLDLAGAKTVFGRSARPKVTTLPTVADTLSVFNTLKEKAAAPEPDEETKRLYELYGLEQPSNNAENPFDRIKQAWQDWQESLRPDELEK